MIGFEPNELARDLDELARKEGYERLDRAAAATALAHAISESRRLAEGRPEHEPAAIFYTFGRRSLQLRPVARPFIKAVLHAQAVASGYDIEVDDVEFRIHCARIALGQMDFPELCTWMAARLRPLGRPSNRPPPKRLR